MEGKGVSGSLGHRLGSRTNKEVAELLGDGSCPDINPFTTFYVVAVSQLALQELR